MSTTSTTLSAGAAAAPSADVSQGASAALPGHVAAVLFASASVVIGVLWDISWHSSIGRDTFWSPPHLAIYLGGIVAGSAAGWRVLSLTFGRSTDPAAVTFWRYFKGPLGAWMAIWGAIAMLTSAPFDDWWHNAYGLDVKILSPPHAVLALGVLGIQLGAVFLLLSLQNRHQESTAPSNTVPFALLFGIASGLLLMNFTVMTTEYTFRIYQHGTLFYQIANTVFLFPLTAMAIAGRVRWPAATAAATYICLTLVLHFLLPLFPAEPRLAPVLFAVERMVPPQFPMLLVVPGLALDLVLRRWGRSANRWGLAAMLSAAFLLSFLLVQWPFADFLQSDLARNDIFKQNVRPYMIGPNSLGVRGEYYNPAAGMELVTGLAVALGLGILAARLGIACGKWMSGVKR